MKFLVLVLAPIFFAQAAHAGDLLDVAQLGREAQAKRGETRKLAKSYNDMVKAERLAATSDAPVKGLEDKVVKYRLESKISDSNAQTRILEQELDGIHLRRELEGKSSLQGLEDVSRFLTTKRLVLGGVAGATIAGASVLYFSPGSVIVDTGTFKEKKSSQPSRIEQDANTAMIAE